MIPVAPRVWLDEDEIVESFVRASGPGGQNVNKVSTAVQLRFDVRGSKTLPDAVKERLERLAGRRLTKEGVIVLVAQRYRTQEQNRADAVARLVEMVREAAVVPVTRRLTRPTLGSKLRRLEGKARRAGVKAMRRDKPGTGGD
ncbi:aminoacyl-tRNA hydrolase [Starkeya sp. 3C]|uniref:Aminoacyl-tRNA hydrolase n=1 Tax=Ancylobacter moscoviensis TaxID=2597768 RepID=A0ABY3DV23_9HYPH|nr:alternative ribosome rescue aminoacyl-tRNA hydrolase ArfB [Ancylobacter moscoviensis]TSJ64188.1 aminoacyl-tRNA hydrolase [Ancylobacter moscoviensis]